MCYGVLQRVAVCCNVQRVAVCCSLTTHSKRSLPQGTIFRLGFSLKNSKKSGSWRFIRFSRRMQNKQSTLEHPTKIWFCREKRSVFAAADFGWMTEFTGLDAMTVLYITISEFTLHRDHKHAVWIHFVQRPYTRWLHPLITVNFTMISLYAMTVYTMTKSTHLLN